MAGGLYYRALTKARDFTGTTQLGLVHTHLLVMLFFLVVLAPEKSFGLSSHSLFRRFYRVCNGGLVLTVVMTTLHGTLTVLGRSSGTAIALTAGLGHILLTAGPVLFFVMTGKCLAGERVRVRMPSRPRHAELY